jgi:hypothetical protein
MRALIALGTLWCSVAIAGTVPGGDDLGITLRVESTTDPQFRVGTQAVLAFEVTRRGPQQATTYSIVGHELLYAGGRHIKLSQVPGASCTLIDLIGVTSPPGLSYFLEGPVAPIGSTATCRVGLRVDAVPFGSAYEFVLHGSVLYPNGSVGPIADPDPSNNRILLPVGSGPQPVPALSPWAVLALLTTLGAGGARCLHRSMHLRPASKWTN